VGRWAEGNDSEEEDPTSQSESGFTCSLVASILDSVLEDDFIHGAIHNFAFESVLDFEHPELDFCLDQHERWLLDNATEEVPDEYLLALLEDYSSSLERQGSLFLLSPDEADLVYDANVKELSNHLHFKTFHPVSNANGRILPSKMFNTNKRLPDTLQALIRSRLVIGGHRQGHLDFNTSSATGRFETLLFLLSVMLKSKLSCFTADVVSAFLETPISSVVFVRIVNEISKILLELRPDWTPFLQQDGSLIVQLDKCVYGLKEAAIAFANHLESLLKPLGFHRSTVDRSLFIRDDPIFFLYSHVDDFFGISDEASISQFVEDTRDLFTYELKMNRGVTLDYLGLKFNIQETHVEVYNPGYVSKMAEALGVDHLSPTPMVDRRASSLSPLLVSSQRESFRSMIMKLLYLTTKTRPDVKFPVVDLARNMSNPTEEDMASLTRVIAFLMNEPDRGLVIREGDIVIKASADAAHPMGEEGEGKGQLAAWLGMDVEGSAGFYTTSQRATTTSTNASFTEIKAAYIATSMIVPFRTLAEECGFPQEGPTTLMQDNASGIQILEKGPGWGGKSRTVPNLYFWITEKIQDGEVTLEHESGKTIVTNGLTKYVSPPEFFKFSEALLGTSPQ
jgi:hypothetical protein